jgi:D-glycero-alpha-D-manno-heptose-7-phosphate kinase
MQTDLAPRPDQRARRPEPAPRPMPQAMRRVISRTPFRVSLFGGGTDYPSWYRVHGGAVLSAAINQYCYISCRRMLPFHGVRHRVVWSHIETVDSLAEILHPCVRVGLQMLGHADADGIELHHQGDLPARSGIGSSSAFAVGMINAVEAMRGRRLGKHELALAAIELEQNWLKDSVGSQDQVAAAYGGLNVIRFGTDGGIRVEPTRLSSDLASRLVANFDQKQEHLRSMAAMVDHAAGLLAHGNLDDLGRLLHETWRLKRELSSGISNQTTDDIYAAARDAGALGGKLLGAGSAGFMVFYVPEPQQPQVRAALRHLQHVPIRIDDAGSTLLNLEQA